MHNPSLRQQPRHESAPPIPLKQDGSILDWLERTGRLISRDEPEEDYLKEEAELVELMGGEDDSDYEADEEDSADLE